MPPSSDIRDIFVGRAAELEAWEAELRRPDPAAILVVGSEGIGKTRLLDRMTETAENLPGLRCAVVHELVTETDSTNSILAQLQDALWRAASPVAGSLANTPQRRAQWRAVLNLVPGLGDLVDSLRLNPQLTGRVQFTNTLTLIGDKLGDDARLVIVLDPEKYIQDGSADDWRLLINDLPPRVKLVFAQRPDGRLVTNRDFTRLDRVRRIPSADTGLNPLSDDEVDELVDVAARVIDVANPREARQAIERYDGYPFSLRAALSLLAEGTAPDDLPPDPEGLAEALWRRAEHVAGQDAWRLLHALAVLEVAPLDLAAAVAGIDEIVARALLNKPFLAGLTRSETGGLRLYHAIFARHAAAALGDEHRLFTHHAAIDQYRKCIATSSTPDPEHLRRLPVHVHKARGDDAFIACVIDEVGELLIRHGENDAAVGLFSEALKLTDSDSDKASLLNNLGLIAQSRGELDDAERYHLKSLSLERQLDRLKERAGDLNNLGLVAQARGDFSEAETLHRESLKINYRLGDLEGIANDLGNLGLLYQAQGNTDRAEPFHRKSLGINLKLGRLENIANDLANLGIIAQSRGDSDRARHHLNESYAIHFKLGRIEGQALCLAHLGVIAESCDDFIEAKRCWTESVNLFKRIGNDYMIEGIQGYIESLPSIDGEG